MKLLHDNAMRLLKLVNALLDFSRLQAGRLRGSFCLTDYSALSRDLAGMFQAAFDKAGIRLVLDCPPLSESIWLDPDLWEKIVPNLVSNAFKFTLSGQVAVRTSETATRAILEVIDTGTGIESKELPHLFERFYRVDGAVGRTHEGAGIGLSLVRELVELHGGRVSAQSRPGIGSVFRVEIPKGSGHLPPAALMREAPSALTRISPHATEAACWQSGPVSPPILEGAARGARVLVVDDNADLRDYLCGLLAPHYRLLTAGDGAEALESIRDDAPDIVVSDVMMPRMNGIELVQAIRSDPTLVAIPVILLSARAGDEATVEGLDAGADDYLTKPFTAQELLARVKAHVQLSQTRRRCTSELEQVNRDLDAFSYSVAHDLRGPLRLIDGFSLMLLEENAQQLDGEGRRRLDVVRSSAKRMSQLIDDLLYLAHLNRNEVRRMPFELSMLVRTVASQLEQDAKGRRVSVEIEPGVMVDGDPQLLRIVLENLLGNAWKFTSRRSDARIEFGTISGGNEVCYFVRDNGAGFDMAYAAKLFTVFQRLHSDADFQGSGIGLATVKRIIGRHGGRVWAEGELGAGATFYFTVGDVQDAALPSSALRQSAARA